MATIFSCWIRQVAELLPPTTGINLAVRWVHFLLLMLGSCLFTGCVNLPEGKEAVVAGKGPAVKQVKLGGAARNLGDIQRPLLTADQFVHKVRELLAEQRRATARRWIERYPDLALESLRCSTAAKSSDPALEFIAQVHDQQCHRGGAETQWATLLLARTANLSRFAGYETVRQQAKNHLENGRCTEAADLEITTRLPANAELALMVDAGQLAGEALLGAGRLKEAERALARAAELGEKTYPYQSAGILLLLSEAQRRTGRFEVAEAAWQRAVESASELLAAPRPIADPIFWERAAYLRPVKTSWPEALVARLGMCSVQPPSAGTLARLAHDEALVWSGIGKFRLDRHEFQAALLALRRAESLAADPKLRNHLQLAQAQALLHLNQEPAALAVLVRLATQAQDQTALSALALLGAVKLQNGNTDQALAFLHRALESGTDWPGRAQAEADLGLVYLARGNEKLGLHWLHSAQERFASAGDDRLLLQSLQNEIDYLDHQGKVQDAEAIRRRVQTLEAT